MLLFKFVAIFSVFQYLSTQSVQLIATPDERSLSDGSTTFFTLKLSQDVDEDITLCVNVSETHDFVVSTPSLITVSGPSNASILPINATNAGQAVLTFCENSNSGIQVSNIDDVYLHVFVVHSRGLNIFNSIIGWIYFVAWSISFYPQIIYNFQRRSVVGLNFDFLAYNLLGFSVYSAYNIGLYWIPPVREEYFSKHPGQLIPVQLNDVVFAVHATIVTAFTIGQCFFLERANQRVSWFARAFIAASFALIFTLMIVASVNGNSFSWLEFLYWIAYIKLVISFIKYIPQVIMNYRRQSTVGWSIGNVLLDFTGGSLSIMQAVLVSYNGADWPSLYADPVKFGLGFLSIFFDIIFMVQHYILYRHNREEPMSGLNKTYEISYDDPDVNRSDSQLVANERTDSDASSQNQD